MLTLPYFQDNGNSEAQVLKIGLSQTISLSFLMFQSCTDLIHDHENLFSYPNLDMSSDPFSESYDSIDLEFLSMNSGVNSGRVGIVLSSLIRLCIHGDSCTIVNQ